MSRPNLSIADVQEAFPQISDFEEPRKGGQKLVFPCRINGQRAALKFLKLDPKIDEDENWNEDDDEVLARAKREFKLLSACDCPNLPKLSGIDFGVTTIAAERVLYFSEEFIEGETLDVMLKSGPFAAGLLLKLAVEINAAIRSLWEHKSVHRDIKPSNIIFASANRFVLLDPGIAFENASGSLTPTGISSPSTLGFASPEQLGRASRDLDFRSDHFLLGVNLYLAATHQHPFRRSGMGPNDVNKSILENDPPSVAKLRSDLPDGVCALIARLLEKRPHLRFRSCDALDEAIGAV